MIEADVLMGSSRRPIMAHPPERTSDIDLDEWMREFVNANKKKGMKLDFKDNDVIRPAINILRRYSHKVS